MMGLILWLVLCVGGGALVGATSASGDTEWYRSLVKPPWNPPSWVFGPVWTTLYALMAVAAWRIWKRGGFDANRPALRLFLLQLLFNFAWSFVFFKFQRIDLALVEIGCLWILIVLTIRAFARIDKPAAWLLVPYLAWVTYAATLNAAIYMLNR
jgi:benzodiazapine receptor